MSAPRAKALPSRKDLMTPVLRAISELGGSGSADEISEHVIKQLNIPDELANIPHGARTPDGRTELEYSLAWTRTTLKRLGYVNNSSRGIWNLTPKGAELGPDFRVQFPKRGWSFPAAYENDWQTDLNKVLIGLRPKTFERLVQRVLRETGFTQVEVTGRTNDGGIDGRGIATINGILSFRVVFQCKRYKGSVSAAQIRDFRGAMIGRADKGLFITTGYFTREAIREATRDGAVAIDLVDGKKLAEKMKALGLGVQIETVERVTVAHEWFEDL